MTPLLPNDRPASERFVEMTKPGDANRHYMLRHVYEMDVVKPVCRHCEAHPRATVHRLPGRTLSRLAYREPRRIVSAVAGRGVGLNADRAVAGLPPVDAIGFEVKP